MNTNKAGVRSSLFFASQLGVSLSGEAGLAEGNEAGKALPGGRFARLEAWRRLRFRGIGRRELARGARCSVGHVSRMLGMEEGRRKKEERPATWRRLCRWLEGRGCGDVVELLESQI